MRRSLFTLAALLILACGGGRMGELIRRETSP